MSIDAVLGKSGSQTGCFYALLNWFRSPTGVSTMIEDYILSCILSLYGRVSQRASLSALQLQAAYPGPPHLLYLPPCILHLMRACAAGTRFASLRAASPQPPVSSHPPPGSKGTSLISPARLIFRHTFWTCTSFSGRMPRSALRRIVTSPALLLTMRSVLAVRRSHILPASPQSPASSRSSPCKARICFTSM